MRKLFALLMAVSMLFTFAAVSMASTWDIAATPGWTIGLQKQIQPASDPITLIGEYGLNEKTLIKIGYSNTTPDTTITVGGQYAFNEQMALEGLYSTPNSGSIDLKFLDKFNINDKLDIVGKIGYATGLASGSTGTTTIGGQAEYKVAEPFIATGGILYQMVGSANSTSFIISGQYQAMENLVIALDYTKPDGDGTFEFLAKYLIK